METLADFLLMLASFSIRMRFLKKALIYSHAGFQLFPEDIRLREIYAYTLLLDNQIDQAESVVNSSEKTSVNLSYIKMRISFFNSNEIDSRQENILSYLNERAI